MLPGYFAIAGAIVASLGGFMYLFETIRGRAKPNRVTWLLWGILPMITFIAQRAQGVGGLSWATFVSGFLPLLVFVASLFNAKAYWKSQPIDYACMVLALIGIIVWALTRQPNLAILFSIMADFSAGFPTLRKTLHYPETESWSAYGLSTLGFLISVAAIHDWNFGNYGFISYLVLMNGALTGMVYYGQHLKNSIST